MASTKLVFANREQHRQWLGTQAPLPAGFRVGTHTFGFTPVEVGKPARMTLTVLALDRPTPDFAAVFTKNHLVGAPVFIGRRRVAEPGSSLGAVAINNKISNVGTADGMEAAERTCAGVAAALGIRQDQVLPASTGVIGWRLPQAAMLDAIGPAVAALCPDSALPAALGIMTTDLYPKIRRAVVGGSGGSGGSIVGFAKGAGMVEPNLATMLVYLLTDLKVGREDLRRLLAGISDLTFNRISVDSDTSTSDAVVLAASGKTPCPDLAAFESALYTVCADLAEDIVRNGEGVRHVMRISVQNAPSEAVARALGRGIANSPLWKTAVSGNDPNVGRLGMALGKNLGLWAPEVDINRVRLSLGEEVLFERGVFALSPEKESRLRAYLEEAELYRSAPPENGIFAPPVDFPPHERRVEVGVDLGSGNARSEVLGADLTHEYVSENADYRS